MRFHRLRIAMVRIGHDRLSGIVEVDDTYIKGKRKGKRDQDAVMNSFARVVAESEDNHIDRIRLCRVSDESF